MRIGTIGSLTYHLSHALDVEPNALWSVWCRCGSMRFGVLSGLARRWLVATGLVAVLALAACGGGGGAVSTTRSAAPSVHPHVGIGDEKLDMFTDARFLALGIKYVRYDMSWDALSVPWQRPQVTAWMNAAKADGMRVLVTIDHSRNTLYKKVVVNGVTKTEAFSQSRVMPTVAQYVAAFDAFRARFPWVTEFATWNETNCYCEVSFNHVPRIAAYYLAVRSACSTCTILAAEFLDVGRSSGVLMTIWAREFVKAAGLEPRYWGLNDYEEANHLDTASTRQLLATVQGTIWLAETGGIVNRYGIVNPGFPQNAAHAALVDRYLLSTIGALSPRIQRIYLYEWDAQTPRDGWDTALISYTGAPRPGYVVLAKTLNAWGIHPNCAISRVPPTCSEPDSTATPRTDSTGSATP